MQPSNKVALLTGGSRGLGRDAALRLADKGINVILTYNQQSGAADEVISLLREKGVKAAALQLDVADAGSFDGFFNEVKETLNRDFGAERFDFLINNAGTGLYTPITDTTEEQFDQMVNIHLKAPYFLTQKALPLMNDGGAIVNLSSGLTRITQPGSSAYASMKTAVETLTRYMAKELGSRGIRANVVAPGAIETDFGNGRVRDTPEINKMIASNTALGRVGLPDDIGGVVAFLCSDDARWINAQRLEVSGGQMI